MRLLPPARFRRTPPGACIARAAALTCILGLVCGSLPAAAVPAWSTGPRLTLSNPDRRAAGSKIPASKGRGGSRADAAGYKLAPGPWPVATIDRILLRDQRRRKNVEVMVRYPRVKGDRGRQRSWPLIVFAHGAGEPRAAFPDLTTHWASYGYVVVLPSHSDTTRRSSRQEPGTTFQSDQMDRLADVVFVLDALDQIEKKMDGFHGRRAVHIDRDGAGVAGHSAGALTAQMAIGVKVRVSRESGEMELKNVGDPRFKAAIVISGQGTINRILTRDSWNDLAKPFLVITGSKDVVPASRETPESRQEPFLFAKPGQKYLVFIEGATHASYAGRAAVSTTDPQAVTESELRMITGVTASATLAFWDAFLDNDERAREYLNSDDLVKFSAGKALVKRK